jgi:hypothetical protein
MAGTVVADTLQADSTSTLVLKNGVANTPPTIQDSAGTQIGTFCRAWVNFNGTTVTNPASMTGVRASFNVSSILDNGTGDYTVNFTNALPDADYATNVTPQATALNTGLMGCLKHSSTPTTSAVRVSVNAIDAGFRDSTYVLVSVFR